MKNRIFLIALFVFIGQTMFALTWNKPNEPDDPKNVIALWHFNDSQSGTQIADASSNGYNLVSTSTDAWAQGGTWNSASNTGYFACNSNYYAELSSNIDVEWTNGLTISFWVRAKPTKDNIQFTSFYLGKLASWGERSRSLLAYNPNHSDSFKPTMRDVGENFKVDPFNDDVWHHIGMVYDYRENDATNIVQIYFDNKLVKSYVNINTSDENLKFFLGCDWEKKGRWNGDIDEFFIYSGVITNFSDGYPAKDIPPPPPPPPLFTTNRYETSFATLDVTNDWSISGMTIYTDLYTNSTGFSKTGRITANQGFLTRRTATLNYSGATSLSNVIITSKQQCRLGNGLVYTEVAARTSNSTNGVYLRVTGDGSKADVNLYDGATLLQTVSSSISSQHNAYDVTLNVLSNQVSATVSNSQDVVSLSGTIVNNIAAGDIRIAASDYNVADEFGRPTIYDIKVEEYIDDPTPHGTLMIIR